MFIELTEILRCPADHEESYVVCVPTLMEGRRVVRGGIGCPVCHAEYPIVDGVAHFEAPMEGEGRARNASEGAVRGVGAGDGVGEEGVASASEGAASAGRPSERASPPPSPNYDASALQAFLDLEGKGGYALLVGSAARHGPDIAALLPGVHFFGVNAPLGLPASDAFSMLRAARVLPVKARSVRAVVLGADHAREPWLGESVRVLLKGLRLVVEDDSAAPDGIAELARGGGLLVGERAG